MANLRKLRTPGSKPAGMDPPKGGAGRSLFHTKVNCSPQALGECLAGVQEYMELMNKFYGAGTHMASLFQDILVDSAYKESAVLFRQSCEQLQKSVEAESASTLAQFQGKWSRLGSRESTPEEGEESKDHIGKDMQLVAESFAEVLQLQCSAFSLGADSMWPFTKLKTPDDMLDFKPGVMETGLAQSDSDLFGQCQAVQCRPPDLTLDMVKDPPKGSPESPSKLNKFSNFLSKIGRSGCEAGGSSFYVAMPEPSGTTLDEAVSRAGHGSQAAMPVNTAAVAMEAGSSLATQMEELHLADKGILLNGELASQEELDNVIDFLSGCPKSSLSTVPEALPTRSVPCTVPPPNIPYSSYLPPAEQLPIGYYGNAMTMSTPAEMYSTAPIQDMTKTHTWPYRVPHKGAPPNLQDPAMSFSQAGYNFDVPTDRDYTRYLAAMTKTKSQQGLVSNGVAPSPWPGGDPGLNKSWPGWFPAENIESATRHWSVVGDSSSCSDDSSNGEVPWMMGLDLANQMGHKRRHSSGGENNFSSCQGPPIGMAGMPDTRPHSVENLREVQAKSSGTWPSRQPWMKPGHGDKEMSGAPMMTPSQWSQPPPTSPAAGPWSNAGLPGAMPPKSPGYAAVAAGTVKADGNAPAHNKLERKYSLHATKPDNNA